MIRGAGKYGPGPGFRPAGNSDLGPQRGRVRTLTMPNRQLLAIAQPDWPPWVPLVIGLLLAAGVGLFLLSTLRRPARPENGLPYGEAEKRRAPRRRGGSVSVEVADA